MAPDFVDPQTCARDAVFKRRVMQLGSVFDGLEGTMSFDEVLTAAMQRTTEVMLAERSSLFLLRDDGTMVSRVLEGMKTTEIVLRPGQGIAGWTARHRVPVALNAPYDDPRFDARFDQKHGFRTRNVLAVPMINRKGRTIGVIEVLNKRTGDFDDDDVTLGRLLAAQLGTIIENFRLIADLVEKNRQISEAKTAAEQRGRELELLLDLESVVARADDVASLAHQTFLRILEAMGCQMGALYLVDTQGATKHIFFSDGRPPMVLPVEPGTGFTGWVASRKREVNLVDAAADPRYVHSIAAKVGTQVHNVLALPLLFPEDTGWDGAVMVCNTPTPRLFGDGEKSVLQLVASQLTKAIVHVRERERREREHRLATVGRLLAGVLHDLKTPMTAITGYAELLAESPPADEAALYLQRIKDALRRIQTMTADIVSFARGERQLLLVRVPLTELMQRYEEEVSAYLKSRGIDLDLRLHTGGTVRLDPEKILRVFWNLTVNAAEAMPDGGALTVEVAHVDDRVLISFTDTGMGVPDPIRDSLFQSFVTFGKTEGTGLGLAVAKEIVEWHGGILNYTSAPGAGATFLVSLPTEAAHAV